jgi:hypothetical protein
MSSHRILRNKKPEGNEIGPDEMERDQRTPVSQVDEGGVPTNNQPTPDETMRPQVPSQASQQDSESGQSSDSIHTILVNLLASVQASKEETASLIRSVRISNNQEETIKIIQERVTEVKVETAKLLESTRDQAVRGIEGLH